MARFTDFHEDLPAEVPEIVMNRIPRIRRWCGMPAGLAGVPPTAVAAAPATPGGGAMPSGGTGSVAGSLSFRRIVDLPFEACVAALESWLHTGQDGDLQIGPSFLRGPAEHDRDSGTCRIEVRLARRPLRPPLRMRLDVDRWSPPPSRTALELIPCQRVRPTATYFRAGHLLLDSLTRTLRQHLPAPRFDCVPPRQPHAHQGQPTPRGPATGSGARASSVPGVTLPDGRSGGATMWTGRTAPRPARARTQARKAGLSPTSRDAVAEATWQEPRLPVVLDARRPGQPHLRCHGRTILARAPAGAFPCRAWTSAAVRPLPPMPQSPLLTSSTITHVTGRRFSPSILTMVSVSWWIISLFCSGVKTPSIRRTLTSGMAFSFASCAFAFVVQLPRLRCSGVATGLQWASIEHRKRRFLRGEAAVRARYPDTEGFIERGGVRVGYEVFGAGEPAILLLTSWAIVHARQWKAQVPYLARHFQVITVEGRGNGRADRPGTAEAYRDREYVDDAIAVLDATGVDRAVVVGLSVGGRHALQLAAWYPERAAGVVAIGAALPWPMPPGLR